MRKIRYRLLLTTILIDLTLIATACSSDSASVISSVPLPLDTITQATSEDSTSTSRPFVFTENNRQPPKTIPTVTMVTAPPNSEDPIPIETGTCQGPACFAAVVSKNRLILINFGDTRLEIHDRKQDGSFDVPYYFDLPAGRNEYGLFPSLITIGPDDVAYVQMPSSGTDPLGKIYAISTDDMQAAIIGESKVSSDMSGDGEFIFTSQGVAYKSCCNPPGSNDSELVMNWLFLRENSRHEVSLIFVTFESNSKISINRLEQDGTSLIWNIDDAPEGAKSALRSIATCDGGAEVWLQNASDGILYVLAPDGSTHRQDFQGTSLIALDPLGGGYLRNSEGLPILEQTNPTLSGELCL